MNSTEISELIQVADAQIHAKQGRSLTLQQKEILRQALGGKRLKHITIEGYSDLTVQQLYCPELWKLLSEATNQKVSIRTVALVLRNLKEQSAGLEPSAAELTTHSLPTEVFPAHSSTSSTRDSAHQSAEVPPARSSTKPSNPASSRVRHNLPTPTYSRFVGRESEIAKLLELLSPRHGAHLISIDGIGGVGKTSLVVEVAYRCLQASQNLDETFQGFPSFDVIIFTSAKQHLLTCFSLLPRISKPHRTLQDIFRQIARTLGNIEITGINLEDQIERLQDALSTVRTLLIVDNLETVENQQDVLSFLYHDLPPTVKAVITTRRQGVFVPLRLSALSASEALQLIQHEADEKGVHLTQDECEILYQRTGGIPVAIYYAIGQMVSCYSVQYVLEQLSQASNDVTRFCFEHSVALVRQQPAHFILMALTFFASPIQRQTLLEVALPQENATAASSHAEEPFAQLQELSLVLQSQDGYSLLPLTREYVMAELPAYPEFEQAARERWVNWCLKLVQRYGGQSRFDWQTQNDVLEAEWSNIQTVLDWCLHQERYEDLCKFWQYLDAHIYLQGSRQDRLKCWGEQLEWMDWLIQMAKSRDPALAIKIMASRGWIYTTIGQPDGLAEAERLYTEAWSLNQTLAQSLDQQQRSLDLAVNLLVLRVHQGQTEMQPWLDHALMLLKQDSIPESKRALHLSRIRYYQGRASFTLGDYAQSETYFLEAVKSAQAINWQKVIHRSRNWLADIATHRGDYATAAQILQEECRSAEVSHDIYQSACCQQSLAQLAQIQNQPEDARRWALQALDNFEKLSMDAEADAIRTLLQTLAKSAPSPV
nr:MAG: RNA polymerase subunit sigma-24 [Leptolyngbya sp. IPPAS B-1204]